MAIPATRCIEQDSLLQPTLYLAFELGKNTWKLGFTIGVAQPPRERTIPAGALEMLQQEIARTKQRFGLPEDARVVSCYEAAHGCTCDPHVQEPACFYFRPYSRTYR